MTTREADKYIKRGEPVLLFNTWVRESFPATIVSRDRRTITTADGGRFERDELQVLATYHAGIWIPLA